MPDDFAADQRASRRVGGSGDPDDGPSGGSDGSTIDSSDFGDDQTASRRVGGSGDPMAPPEPVRETTTVDTTTNSGGTLDDLSTGFTRNVAQPAGDVARTVSPVAQASDRFGSGTVGRSRELVVESGVDSVNPFALAQSGIAIGEAGVEDTRNIVEDGPIEGSQENLRDAGNAARTAAGEFASGVRSDPVGTLSRTGGALVGGALFGTAAARGARAAGGAVRRADGPDAGGFVDDTRAQADGGRRATDTPDQETIAVERMADEDAIDNAGTRDIEEIPGVSVQNRGGATDDVADAASDTQSLDELEAEIRERNADLIDDTGRADVETETTAAGVGAFGAGAFGAEATADGTASFDAVAPFDGQQPSEPAEPTTPEVEGGTIDDTTTTDDTTTEPVTQTVTETATVADTTTGLMADTATIEDLTQAQEPTAQTEGVTASITSFGPQNRVRPRAPDPDSDIDDEIETDPVGAIGADFVNPARGLDEASEDIVSGLDDLGVDNGP